VAPIDIDPVVTWIFGRDLLFKQRHERRERESRQDTVVATSSREVMMDAIESVSSSRCTLQVEMIDAYERSGLGAKILEHPYSRSPLPGPNLKHTRRLGIDKRK
jgi:hypothetical protein